VLPALKCRVGVLFDRGSRKRLKVSRFSVRSMQSKQATEGTFAGKAMIKGAFSHGIQMRASKRHRRALPSSHGGFAERICVRRFVSGTIQRWFSGLCRVGREVKESGGWSSRHGRSDLPEEDQKGPRGRQLVQERTSRRCRRKEGARKLALSDTLSAGRDRDGGEHAERERSRGRRRSRTRCSKQRCQWGWQRPW